MSTTSDYLLAYGTLQPTFNNPYADFLKLHCHYVGVGHFSGVLVDLGDYPGAIYRPNQSTKVYGTVCRLVRDSRSVFSYLDAYEGVGAEFESPTEYVRSVIPAYCDGEVLNCWVYVYNWSIENKLVIASGNYSDYLQSR